MIHPDYREFSRLARQSTLVPVVKSITADLLTPVSAFLAIAAREPNAFLLESIERGEQIGRYTFLGAQPYMRLEAHGSEILLHRGKRKEQCHGSALQTAKELLRQHRPAAAPGLPPFTAGAVGYCSYDIVRQLENIGDCTKDDLSLPDCMLKIRSETSRQRFVESVQRAKEYIAAGDIFQVVLSLRLDFTPEVAPFDIYRALRTVNPSPYMYFLRMGDTHILGSSPEMLVRATGRKLEYRPIAGTHPRGRDEAEDARLEKAMLEDEKERAEHVMLVDLGRNDIGRVSEYGSVKVRDLMFVERYSHVMHIVSALEGKLRSDMDAIDAFAACFPAGTLSGAPKVRAMQIIEELEPTRRAIYGGSVLYADFAGNLDSCIAIRTMLMKGKKAYLQVGAGIVADSDAEREYEECMNKAKAVLRAVEAARGAD